MASSYSCCLLNTNFYSYSIAASLISVWNHGALHVWMAVVLPSASAFFAPGPRDTYFSRYVRLVYFLFLQLFFLFGLRLLCLWRYYKVTSVVYWVLLLCCDSAVIFALCLLKATLLDVCHHIFFSCCCHCHSCWPYPEFLLKI